MRVRPFFLTLVLCCVLGTNALGWENTGHVLIAEAGALGFPASLPSFVRTPAAVSMIADLSNEADLVKFVGNPHDGDRNPAHYVDIGDDGTIDGISLDAMPATRRAYDTALRQAGADQYGTGFLPYSLMDGWQQLVKDFGYWRVDAVGERRARTLRDRQFFTTQRRLREILTLRDIGVWSHFVGDASQPLHTSTHFDGWDRYGAPKGIHERFEGPFVQVNISLGMVRSAMRRYRPCSCSEWEYIARYLRSSNSEVVPLYELGASTDSFRVRTPDAVRFTTDRLAAGAEALRDMVVQAWEASPDTNVGYPLVRVRDVVSGRVVPTPRTVQNGH
jgi:hypothetical protein